MSTLPAMSDRRLTRHVWIYIGIMLVVLVYAVVSR